MKLQSVSFPTNKHHYRQHLTLLSPDLWMTSASVLLFSLFYELYWCVVMSVLYLSSSSPLSPLFSFLIISFVCLLIVLSSYFLLLIPPHLILLPFVCSLQHTASFSAYSFQFLPSSSLCRSFPSSNLISSPLLSFSFYPPLSSSFSLSFSHPFTVAIIIFFFSWLFSPDFSFPFFSSSFPLSYPFS